MKKTRLALAGAALAMLAAMPVQAHHAAQASYDTSKLMTMQAVLEKVDWINPHIYFHFLVKTPDGATEKWAFESAGPNGMRRAGLAGKSVFTVGDTYTITYNPSWKPDVRLGFIAAIKWPNGRVFQRVRVTD